MACGAKGVISVTANIIPAEVKAMVTAVNEGRWEDARRMHLSLLDIHNAMFIESNPVPVKTALSLMGKCRGEVSPAPGSAAARQPGEAQRRDEGIRTDLETSGRIGPMGPIRA